MDDARRIGAKMDVAIALGGHAMNRMAQLDKPREQLVGDSGTMEPKL